jgi:hypothetical protein
MIRPFCFLALALSQSQLQTAASRGLTQQEMHEAIAVGRRCEAPIVRVTRPDSEFAVYIESPSGRAALVTAAATLMHQSIDASHVRRSMLPGYRVWVQRADHRWHSLTILNITARHLGRIIEPTSVRTTKLFLGTVPSHGILPDLRMRSPEFTFSDLPAVAFDLDIETNQGHRRLRVDSGRSLMRVCN